MKPVEVIIAVHTPTRPIARAVASVLDGNAANSSVTVVCHNVEPDGIAEELPLAHRDQVRFLAHTDEFRSASGPFNAGMRASTAEFVSIMGSDDTLSPGAVDSWLGVARKTGAESVLTRLCLGEPGKAVPTPPARRWHQGLADPIKDRLSYRSAPLGLVSNAARQRIGAELVEGMRVGGDVSYVTRLWCETKVAIDRNGPGYVIGEDAADRVTLDPRSITEEFTFLRHLLAQDWLTGYPQDLRTAIVTKLVRIHVFGAIWYRQDSAWWTEAERLALAEILEQFSQAAPDYAKPLSRADHAVLDAASDPSVPALTLLDAARDRRRHGRPATVIPAHLGQLLHPEAPPRFMAASWLATRA